LQVRDGGGLQVRDGGGLQVHSIHPCRGQGPSTLLSSHSLTHQVLQVGEVPPQLLLVVVHEPRVGDDDQRPPAAERLEDAARPRVADDEDGLEHVGAQAGRVIKELDLGGG